MGVLEPLISQALGRSPYDEVVPGEGPPEPPVNGYVQQYDERGRPINPDTKRINKDIIRSHNEIMTIIGVAEPDNGIIEAQAEAAIRHQDRDELIGERFVYGSGFLETSCIWGVNGIRQRILLYKEYSNVSFLKMFFLPRPQQSRTEFWLGGMPSFMLSTLIEHGVDYLMELENYQEWWSVAIRRGCSWIRLHLAIYTFFQRTGILPCDKYFPHWKFFVPGTSISPIYIPPLPTSFCPIGISQWLGSCCLAVAPIAGFYLYTKVHSVVARFFRILIYSKLPKPKPAVISKRMSLRDITPISSITRALQTPAREPSTVTETPTPREDDTIVVDNTIPGAAAPRRQSTVSLRGAGPAMPIAADDFGSDDEEGEVGATLISFDVEPTESTVENFGSNQNENAERNTPGPWAAELRPNYLELNRSSALAARGPVHRDNALTRLAATLAMEVLALPPARLLVTPVAAWAWLSLSRQYMTRMGMSLVCVHGPSIWGIFTRQGCFNLLATEGCLLIALGNVWSLMVTCSWRYMMTEEQWNEREGIVG
ncbi:hypothetical protein QBC38DRAFT_388091 [Podospora fimiseda]|uniref:Uncharacterized protein n=1 Tax=Podospora fimiseda TaxID=252190 RepID=A0AAN7BSQ7_9PEZI|nr:hypothetical protein QBC38DRAFT_388091 [Podospora fimiseda]